MRFIFSSEIRQLKAQPRVALFSIYKTLGKKPVFETNNNVTVEKCYTWLTKKDRPALLEIFTPAEKNAEIPLEYFRYL
ncbi:MAG: hypothetical protein DRJ02_06785 [Bacteroidetes bacterium]|nr:MAG: hypothetical protein DRI87_02990 [Bacteroidota bacterium]RLD87273.1 MAG: hypothetical protein DRJ02_06785 [Bacteroidota bacterium]